VPAYSFLPKRTKDELKERLEENNYKYTEAELNQFAEASNAVQDGYIPSNYARSFNIDRYACLRIYLDIQKPKPFFIRLTEVYGEKIIDLIQLIDGGLLNLSFNLELKNLESEKSNPSINCIIS
jgi:hypothetical protein